MEKNSVTFDAFAFMRARAAELLDEGELRLARRLLAEIDKEQVRRIRQASKAQTAVQT